MPETKINRTKKIVTGLLLLAALAVVSLAATHRAWFGGGSKLAGSAMASQQPSPARKILFWYDPMHPAYQSDKPGIAPDCGMTLVPKYAEEPNATPMPEGTVTLNAGKQSMAGVRTVVVQRAPLVREIRTTAQIVADESRISHVHVKVSGYIDHVFVGAVGQLVRKGDPLFTLYSPDLVAAEEEYLIARRGNASLGNAPYSAVRQGAASLLASSRQKLKLLDVTDEQIAHLEQSGEVARTITIYAPASGFVTDRKAYPQAAITPETELYTVSDLSLVWAIADIFEYEAAYVRIGQSMTLALSYQPGKTYTGKISFIYPSVDAQTHTLKARMELANPGLALKPQMFADATLHIDYGRPLLVPQEAVLDSGSMQQVFVVHAGGVFEPRRVTIGAVIDGQAVVLSGLKEGETVVGSGNFLIDSESRMTAGAAR